MEPIRFPGASTPRSTPDQPPFGPALTRADSAGRNGATRENGASPAPTSERKLDVETGSSRSGDAAAGDDPITERSEPRGTDDARDDLPGSGTTDTNKETGASGDEPAVERPSDDDVVRSEDEPRPEDGSEDGTGIGIPLVPGRFVTDPASGSKAPIDTGTIPSGDLPGSPGGLTAGSGVTTVSEAVSTAVPTSVIGSPANVSEASGTTMPVEATSETGSMIAADDADSIALRGMNEQTAVGNTVRDGGEGSGIESSTTADPRRGGEVAGRIEIPEGASTTRHRGEGPTPEPLNGPRDRKRSDATDEKRPAAVARADRINEAVREARSQSSNQASTASMPVTDVSGATRGSNRHAPPIAQTLPNHPAGAAPDPADEGRTRTMPGVGRGLETLARQRGGTLTMRLDPPSLGPLRLEMKMEAGRVAVLLTSASDSARSLLRDNLGSLRQALEDRGLAVDRLAVESAGRTSEGSSNQRSDNRGDGQDTRGGQEAADRQDAGDGRSRGRRDEASGRRADQGSDPQRPEVANFDEAMVQATASDN